ncbi:hypothetical protein NY547_09355 [Cnuibacter physcomitrellae]|uniref:hypothetical protein n=1 Tax=Cnuibacter physcomitrellae TaxID=1619308 RepID=UPI0021757AE2|nr:hypothetical protein [Cnuibacter physcomitrellae]MCS5497442.1 hypothetical protein [Cnuibacter physcomitrellae]
MQAYDGAVIVLLVVFIALPAAIVGGLIAVVWWIAHRVRARRGGEETRDRDDTAP